MDYWVKVAQLLGHESRGRIDRAVRTRDPEHRQRLLMQSEIAFMLRDCLVFAMEPEDRERAFELPEIFGPNG